MRPRNPRMLAVPPQWFKQGAVSKVFSREIYDPAKRQWEAKRNPGGEGRFEPNTEGEWGYAVGGKNKDPMRYLYRSSHQFRRSQGGHYAKPAEKIARKRAIARRLKSGKA